MTGRRRPKGKPVGVVASAQRRHAHFESLLADADDPRLLVAVAVDYLRAALTHTHHEVAKHSAHDIAERLITEAQRLQAATVAAAKGRERRRSG